MNKAKVTAGIILLFLLGGVTGGLTVQLYHRQVPRPEHHRPPSASERTDFIMARLKHDLDLTPDQVVHIRPIMLSGEQAIAALMDRIDPEVRKIHEAGFAAIREKLEPEQQRTFDEIRERMKRFRRKPERP